VRVGLEGIEFKKNPISPIPASIQRKEGHMVNFGKEIWARRGPSVKGRRAVS